MTTLQLRNSILRATFIAGLLPALVLLLSIQSSYAGSATWQATPATGDWNTAANWTAGGPPNGSADTATFALSNITGVALSLNTEVNGILFNAGGSAFTITASPSFTLTISGVGVTNNSGMTQNFVTAVDTAHNLGTIAFTNSATAGSLTAFTVYGGEGEAAPGSIVQFSGTSTASNATFTVNGGIAGTLARNSTGGLVEFLDSSSAGNGIFTLDDADGDFNGPGIVNFFGTSTAGNGTFTLVGGTNGAGAQMNFHDSSTAGNGIFTITVAPGYGGGAGIAFYDSSTPGNGIFTVNGSDGTNGSTLIGNSIYFFTAVGADNATVIANGGLNGGSGGTIRIASNTGSTARIEVFGNGLGDYTSGSLNEDTNQNVPPVTIGSIEGNGVVFLGGLNLIVGNNNLNTTFSGVIQDGRQGGTGGSLTKIGTGVLTLQGRETNDYFADNIDLILVSGSIINLNFSGPPDVIASLVVDGVAQPTGVYGSATSDAPNPLPEFTGSGTVQVQTAPSPTPTPTPTIQVSVQTSPTGLSFTVDSNTYSSTQTFSWVPGSSHTIATTSPQNGAAGVRYAWMNWSGGGAISHIVTPTTNKTYTATFRTQYYLTMAHGTGGTVSPASAWKNSGAAVSITATPASGYSFSGWTGSGAGSYSGTNNPASITMNGPITETAAFTHNAVQVTVQTNPAGRSFTVDGTPYTAAQTFSWVPGSSHTIATTSPQNGATGIRYVWTNWSGGGAISHIVAPTTNKIYTATFNTQYFLTMSHNTGGTVTPVSAWKPSGATISLSATAASGYHFTNWNGSGTGSFSGTNNPALITMGGPITETATFTHN